MNSTMAASSGYCERACLAGAGLPAPVVVGARMALQPGRGAKAVPVRTTVAGLTVGIAVLSSAVTFAASLDQVREGLTNTLKHRQPLSRAGSRAAVAPLPLLRVVWLVMECASGALLNVVSRMGQHPDALRADPLSVVHDGA